jgi:hypothetical protein
MRATGSEAMEFGRLIDELTKDWQWLTFLAQYCAGRNIGKAFCDDVRWWALGIAVLVVVIVLWWIIARVASAYENWRFRGLSAKVADEETMKQHVWSGDGARAAPPQEPKGQRPR